jgi:hypothetical protein
MPRGESVLAAALGLVVWIDVLAPGTFLPQEP